MEKDKVVSKVRFQVRYKARVYPARVDKGGYQHDKYIHCKPTDGEPYTFCCQAMREKWEDSFEFGHDGEPKVFLIRHYDNEDDCMCGFNEYYPIAFCPFCGAKIECTEVERVQMQLKQVVETVTHYEFVEPETGQDKEKV